MLVSKAFHRAYLFALSMEATKVGEQRQHAWQEPRTDADHQGRLLMHPWVPSQILTSSPLQAITLHCVTQPGGEKLASALSRVAAAGVHWGAQAAVDVVLYSGDQLDAEATNKVHEEAFKMAGPALRELNLTVRIIEGKDGADEMVVPLLQR